MEPPKLEVQKVDENEKEKEGKVGLYRIDDPESLGVPSLELRGKRIILTCEVTVVHKTEKMRLSGFNSGGEGFSRITLMKVDERDLLKSFPFKITYNYEDDFPCRFYLGDFKEEEFDEKLYRIKFVIERTKHFTIQFNHPYDYQIVKKVIDLKNRTMYPEKYNEIKAIPVVFGDIDPKEDLIIAGNDVINNYKKKKAQKKKIHKKFSAAVGSGVQKQKEEYFLNLCNKKPNEWTLADIYEWFKQIPIVQTEKKNRLISLFDYITDINIRLDFDEFLADGGAPFVLLKRKIEEFMKKSPKNRRSFVADTNQKPIVRAIFSKKEVVERIVDHIKILCVGLKNQYRPTYYTVLKKQLYSVYMSNQVRTDPTLFRMKYVKLKEEKLLFEGAANWSLFALRRKILFSFLYGKDVMSFVNDMKMKIMKLRRKYPSMKTMGLFEKFKEENDGLELDKLDLELWLDMNANKARTEWAKSRTEVMRKKMELMNVEDEVKSGFEVRIKTIKAKLEDPKLKQGKIREGIEKTLASLPTMIDRMVERKKKELEQEVEKLHIEQDKKHMKYVSAKVNEKLKKEKKYEFYGNYEIYYKTVDSLIQSKLQEIFPPAQTKVKEDCDDDDDEFLTPPRRGRPEAPESVLKNAIALSTKLVLSRRLGHAIDFLPRIGGSLLSRFEGVLPVDFFKFGFTHGYILICNVGIHWGGSEVVFCSNVRSMTNVMKIYEDLACLDSHAQTIFTDESSFLEFVTNCSRFILRWNTDNTYSKYGFSKLGRSKFSQNCQEFCLDFLKFAGAPFPFRSEIMEYIESLKTLDNIKEEEDEGEEEEEKEKDGDELLTLDEEKKISRRYRTISIQDTLPEKLKEAISKIYKKRQKVDSVKFGSHQELDHFVYKVLSHYENAEAAAPGFFQLLKGFDRAFWVAKMYRQNPDDTNEPASMHGECICNWMNPPEIHE